MDPNRLREQVRAQVRAALANRATQTETISTLRASAAAGETVTDEQVAAALAARAATDREVDALEARDTELTAEIERESAINRLQDRVAPGATGTGPAAGTLPGSDRGVRVGQEPRTYARELDPAGRMFLRDVGLLHLHGGLAVQSMERLQRHMSEERVERGHLLTGERGQHAERAAGTGAFAGLTVPQYLTDMYAPLARAMRPFADACNGHTLPEDGMTLNLSRITTGTSAALQATENTAVSETNIDDTLLTINVQTNAGQQTLSRQAVERGTGTEEVTVQDLFRAYSTTLDNTLVNQAATGLAASATTITYTDASPTGPELYANIVAGLSGVESIMLNMASGDNIAVMHSRRWYKLQSSLSAAYPMISQPGIQGTLSGVNYAEVYGMGARGLLPNGTPVIVDNNIVTNLGAGTNQDEVYVADRQECHLWEDPSAPVFIRAEQPAAGSLGILFVLYGYFAYTFGRYPGQNQKITGTGLTPPVFDGS
jgi:hypothetical protein